MQKPHISKPCHEDWNAMTPQSGGRHCDDCNKTVRDFTGWSDSEISTYLSEHSNQRICGRFTPDQLNEKISPLHDFSDAGWKRQFVCSKQNNQWNHFR